MKSYGLRNTASRAASLAERRNSMPEVSVSLQVKLVSFQLQCVIRFVVTCFQWRKLAVTGISRLVCFAEVNTRVGAKNFQEDPGRIGER